jgi:hypothetical protein
VSVDVIACIAAEAGPIELLLTMKYPVTDRAINEILTTDSVINLAIIAPIFSGELLHRAYLANAPKCAEYIMKRMMCWRCFLNNKTILGEDCSGHRTLRKSDMNLIKQLIIFGADINNVQLHIFNV